MNEQNEIESKQNEQNEQQIRNILSIYLFNKLREHFSHLNQLFVNELPC